MSTREEDRAGRSYVEPDQAALIANPDGTFTLLLPADGEQFVSSNYVALVGAATLMNSDPEFRAFLIEHVVSGMQKTRH
ncbi:hypothetical protein [Salinarimonas rosea]|uniref:hypothetical protein n=1 Tax=Salinarimonas rosea TaxID=552063 RepID=UPI00048BD764|nr:hypothetical protein [Salinarimonas rosea]